LTEKSANGFAGLFVLLIVTGILGYLFFMRHEDSISLSAPHAVQAETTTFAESGHFWQLDPMWRDMPMNGTDYTLGDSGCLVCCIGAVIELQKLPVQVRTDPASMNVFLGAHSVYDTEANIRWAPLEESLSVEAVCLDAGEFSPDEPARILAEGCYPIVRVIRPETGTGHFVLITDYRDGIYYCMDPALKDGKDIPLSHYGNRIYAIRYLMEKS